MPTQPLTSPPNKSMREIRPGPHVQDPTLRQFIIDLLRQQEGLKKKLQALLDK